jgi:hypothetical protein
MQYVTQGAAQKNMSFLQPNNGLIETGVSDTITLKFQLSNTLD